MLAKQILTPILDMQVMPDPPTLTRLLLHVYSYTPTLTRLLTPIVDMQVMADPLAPGAHLLAAKDLAQQVARIY